MVAVLRDLDAEAAERASRGLEKPRLRVDDDAIVVPQNEVDVQAVGSSS